MKTTLLWVLLVSMLQMQVDSLCDLAYEREDAGDFREAVRLNEEALALTPEDSLEWISILCNNLSTEYFYLCELETAADYAYRALRIDEQRQDSIGLSSSLNHLLSVRVQMKQYDEARSMSARAVRIEEELVARGMDERRSVLASRLGIESEILTRLGRFDESIQASERAIAIDRELGDNSRLGIHLAQLGNTLTEQKRYAEALPYLQQSLGLLSDAGHMRSVIITLVPYAEALDHAGRRSEAIAALRRSVTMSYETGQRDTRLHAVYDLALLEQGEAVREHLEHYTRLRDSIYSDQMQSRVVEMEVKYDTEKKELEIARQQVIVQRQQLGLIAVVLAALLLAGLIIFIYVYARAQKASAEEKNRMVSILSHDLKSPAMAQQRVLRLMADGGLPATDDVMVQLAEAQDKQVNLILNMLDYARLEAGRVVAEPIVLELRTIAADVVGLLSQQAKQRQVTLAVAEEANTLLEADRTMTHTIMRNLVSNAIKFSPEGGTVTIRIVQDGFCVEDQGRGFGSNHGEKGTGLGLNICRRFASLNHATLTIASGDGQPTQVRVRFQDRAIRQNSIK